MLSLLAILAILPAAEQAEQPERRAKASVRIVSSVRASRDAWNKAPPSRRRTITVREADGRVTRVRVIEYE